MSPQYRPAPAVPPCAPGPRTVPGRDVRAMLTAIVEGKVPRPATLDLRGVDLQRLDLRRADLSGWDLRGANLHGADLRDADLCQARLARCNLGLVRAEGALLIGAELDDANLAEADLSRARLSHASLRHAVLTGARLERAVLDDADLTGAQLDGAALSSATLHRARLVHCRLVGAEATDTDFSDAEVDHADFRRADLRSARLRGVRGFSTADWITTDLRDVDFSGAYQLRREAIDQNYLAEFRAGGPASAVLYEIWRLTSDCGRSVVRWGLTTAVSMLGYAAVYVNLDIDYGENPTLLSPLYFSVITMTSLGYGDVLPRSAAAQATAMSQAVFGYVMLGGLLSIISNKMARRGE